MRQKRATMSGCVKLKMCPTCNEPDTVGGGVSMEKTDSRVASRSKP